MNDQTSWQVSRNAPAGPHWLSGFGVTVVAPTLSELSAHASTVGIARGYALPSYYRQVLRRYERLGAGFVIIESGEHAPGGTNVPRVPLDVFALLGFFLASTTHLGLVVSFDSHELEPYHAARALATADHASQGRVGWELRNDEDVTGHAQEFAEVLAKLWLSWAPDAWVMDQVSGRWLDGAKIQPVNHIGAWFNVRGPLSIPRSPQVQPPRVTRIDRPGTHAAGIPLLSPAGELFDGRPDSNSIVRIPL